MQNRKSDISIETLRIVGALMVIGTHLKLHNVVDGIPSKWRIAISCVVGDGVALFWLITGCFFFKEIGYGKRLKKMLTRIALPTFTYLIIAFYLYGFLLGIRPLTENIHHPIEHYKGLLDGLLKWEIVVEGSGHLWYMLAYMLVICLYPLFDGIRKCMRKGNRGALFNILLLFGILVYNDLSFNGFAQFSHHSINAVAGAGFFILLGDILYSNREKIKPSLSTTLIGTLLYLLVNGIRAFIQYRCYLSPMPTEEPIYWYTSYGFVSVISIWLIIRGFSGILERPGLSRIIAFIGGQTFGIYFLHYPLLDYLNRIGLQDSLIRAFGDSGAGNIGYELVYMIIVFLGALLLSCVLTVFIKCMKRIRLTRPKAR